MSHAPTSITRLQRTSLMAAVAGAVVCAAIVRSDPHRLWPAYLVGFLACWLICVGGMGLLALGNLTGGRWAVVGRPFYRAATQTIWLIAILFIPIGAFTEHIYPWANATGAITLPPAKATYLDSVFFCQRAAGYFVVWLVLSWLLSIVSWPELPPASTPAMRRMGAITLVLLVPTATFAAFDWGMSLEPAWYSSIYGAILSAGGVLGAHALAVIGAVTIGGEIVDTIFRRAAIEIRDSDEHELRDSEGTTLDTVSGPALGQHLAEIFNELGNLLLAFLMVNTYFALSQFLIIWTGNLPSEITWYLRRMASGWGWLAFVMVVFHFVVPFLMLLSRDVKRSPRQLRQVAIILLAMYLTNLYWMIVPAFEYRGVTGYVLNVAALTALFGGWLAVFAWYAKRNIVRG